MYSQRAFALLFSYFCHRYYHFKKKNHKSKHKQTKWLTSQTDSDQPAHFFMWTAKTMTKQCQYQG